MGIPAVCVLCPVLALIPSHLCTPVCCVSLIVSPIYPCHVAFCSVESLSLSLCLLVRGFCSVPPVCSYKFRFHFLSSCVLPIISCPCYRATFVSSKWNLLASPALYLVRGIISLKKVLINYYYLLVYLSIITIY